MGNTISKTYKSTTSKCTSLYHQKMQLFALFHKFFLIIDRGFHPQVKCYFAASAPGGYQAILMDVMMPVMNGFEASRAIRALDRPDAATVPILAMTAQASDECAQSCHQVGMNGRLVKPLDAKKLAKSIREAVQNKQ